MKQNQLLEFENLPDDIRAYLIETNGLSSETRMLNRNHIIAIYENRLHGNPDNPGLEKQIEVMLMNLKLEQSPNVYLTLVEGEKRYIFFHNNDSVLYGILRLKDLNAKPWFELNPRQ